MDEFALIGNFFRELGALRRDVVLGVGDDAAVLAPPPGRQLVMATDTLVAGVHFPDYLAAADIGYRALAVNLSDLAAMGAEPAWATLALTLPQARARWLGGFARGFGHLAAATGVQLVGGDTTRGPLTVTVTLTGFAPASGALTRAGADAGDALLVSGTPGDAALGLARCLDKPRARGYLVNRFKRPSPRLALGLVAAGHASAAIDLSDGLLVDLAHVCKASGCAARVEADAIPLSAAARRYGDAALRAALHGGDDYELLLAVPPRHVRHLQRKAAGLGCPLTRIGLMTAGAGVALVDGDGAPVTVRGQGYRHF
ncbi:MAG: thiamine-phosphate kinase [Gammaproteobacteria bacterium]|nr:thiamine-phosphate kinase [Gammaproteobacteria bacterium]